MKGYNFNRAANGAYSDNPEVDTFDTSDRNAQFDLPANRCVYGDMEGVPFLFVVGPDADQYDAYDDLTKLYMEYYEGYTSVGIKMGTEDLPSARQFTMEMYDGNGRVGTYYADPPSRTSGGTAMGTNHNGTSHNAYMAEDRQGINEIRQDGEYFYEYSSDGDPIWSGPDEGQWNAGEVLIVAPSDSPPPRWPDGSITETTLDATIESSIPNRMCPGDSATITIEMSNDHVISDIRGTINQEVFGSGASVNDFIVGPGETETIDINLTIPDSALPTEQEVASISISSDADVRPNPSKSFTTIVGTQPDEVQLENVELPSEIVGGRELSGSIDAANDGECTAETTVSYTIQ